MWTGVAPVLCVIHGVSDVGRSRYRLGDDAMFGRILLLGSRINHSCSVVFTAPLPAEG